jgi:hypothetical protein
LALSVGEVDERLHFHLPSAAVAEPPGVRRGIGCGRECGAG